MVIYITWTIDYCLLHQPTDSHSIPGPNQFLGPESVRRDIYLDMEVSMDMSDNYPPTFSTTNNKLWPYILKLEDLQVQHHRRTIIFEFYHNGFISLCVCHLDYFSNFYFFIFIIIINFFFLMPTQVPSSDHGTAWKSDAFCNIHCIAMHKGYRN